MIIYSFRLKIQAVLQLHELQIAVINAKSYVLLAKKHDVLMYLVSSWCYFPFSRFYADVFICMANLQGMNHSVV